MHICRCLAIISVFVFCLTQLSGCSLVKKCSGRSNIDGPPSIDVDESKIPDAVPKEEPYHPHGTKDYVVGGRRYHVLKNSKGYVQTGYASWYGSKFHGNHTSTQERYSLYGMTAASKDLPLPSYAQVTNLRNGKKIIVRVNDRGPFHSNRIIDLSYVAAKKLGFVNNGTAMVKVVAIDPKTWKDGKDITPTIAASQTEKIYLQVGAYSQPGNAKKSSVKVAKITGKPTSIERKNNLYRVYVGPLASTTQADKIKQALLAQGYTKINKVNKIKNIE